MYPASTSMRTGGGAAGRAVAGTGVASQTGWPKAVPGVSPPGSATRSWRLPGAGVPTPAGREPPGGSVRADCGAGVPESSTELRPEGEAIAAGRPEEANNQFKLALAIEGASAKAREAAAKGVQDISGEQQP